MIDRLAELAAGATPELWDPNGDPALDEVVTLRVPPKDCDYIIALDPQAVLRLISVVRAAEAVFAQEEGVCVGCGWVGDHAVNPDSFARECLTLPLRVALREVSE